MHKRKSIKFYKCATQHLYAVDPQNPAVLQVQRTVVNDEAVNWRFCRKSFAELKTLMNQGPLGEARTHENNEAHVKLAPKLTDQTD